MLLAPQPPPPLVGVRAADGDGAADEGAARDGMGGMGGMGAESGGIVSSSSWSAVRMWGSALSS